MKKQIFVLMAMCVSCVLSAQTYIMTHVAGTPYSVGLTGNGGPATAALMGAPWDICTDAAGNVYILDNYFAGIRRIDTAGIIDHFAGTGTSGYTGNGGPATAAQLSVGTGGIAADRNGNVYITEHWGHTIRKIDPSGIITHVAGTYGTSGFSGDGGPASAATLYMPSRIVADHTGNIYFMDAGNKRVRKIDTAGIITTVAGNGTATPTPNGLPATATSINDWSPLAVDRSGNLFIGYGQRIIRVDTAGIANAFAGSTTAYPGPGTPTLMGEDGLAADHTFFNIREIATDKSGNLFVMDGAHISIIDSTGYIRRVGGSAWVGGYSGNGGIATLAHMYPGYGMHVAENNDVYFVEELRQGVRKLVFANFHPSYAEGNIVTVGSCTPGTTFALDSALRVMDLDTADTLVWSVLAAPLHGTVTDSVTAMSNGAVVMAAGFSYTADTGFVGVDSFVVRVYDGLEHDDITVWVTIVSPTSGIGGLQACMDAPAPLTYTAHGGMWTAGDTAIATIDPVSGMLTPVTTGTTTVTYELYAGCSTTAVVTVNAAVSAITGAGAICSGVPTALSVTPGGGTWASSEEWLATVDAYGVVTGVTDSGYVLSNMEATIHYTAPTGCRASVVLTVNATPLIWGSAHVCEDAWATLSTIHTSAVWSSSDTGVVNAYSYGGIHGVSAGSAIISLTGDGGCVDTLMVTVTPKPVISGTFSLCDGSSTLLTALPSGGTWTSSVPAVAAVDDTGLFAAHFNPAYGTERITSTIEYTAPDGCAATAEVTVNGIPAITGAGSLCVGQGLWLASTLATTGVWESSDTMIADVDGGTVTGIAPGSVVVTFTSATGCRDTALAVVNDTPTVTYPANLCAGATFTLTATTPAGSWASYNPYAVTITGGVATGVAAGTATIFYNDANGCYAHETITVHDASPTYGTASVCSNDSTTLVNLEYGGTWSSASPSVATIGAATGVVYPVSAGTADITYTGPSTCQTVTQVTVMPAPPAIAGATLLCADVMGAFSPMMTGIAGTWSSSNEAVIEVKPSSGNYQTAATGTATVSYTYANGCYSAVVVTVISTPSTPAVTGSTTMTVGGTQTLTGTPAGGTWSSGNTSRATVGSASGDVLAIAAGSVTIFYTVTNMCGSASKGIRINITSMRPAGELADAATQYAMYPNPTSGLIHINAPEEGSLSVLSVDGRVVLTSALRPGSNTLNLPVSLAAGIYMCHIVSVSGDTYTARIEVSSH